MMTPRVALTVGLIAVASLVGPVGQAHADDITVTITPTVVIVTDTTGKPIRTETIYPKPAAPAATPDGQQGPRTVTVTVTPGNPGILTLGQNDAGQWIGMVIGMVLGALTTVAVGTRRRPVNSTAHADPPPPEQQLAQAVEDTLAPQAAPAMPRVNPPSEPSSPV